ncbi:helix-turn-helix domain-containing protein [Nocardioides terrisoli]|uniref:helix-turn-helix domain-containing protein n=1 Tax=Nocardioides terrisoli TaxID=3388267 RepID=UPI00287BBB57|nr:helix-turn-helix domain-containing protein [Nocardioides marmorisolisilvae]
MESAINDPVRFSQLASEVNARSALEAWLRVSRALVDDLPLEETLDIIAQVARDLTGNVFAMVALADERAERLVVRGAAGLDEDYLVFANSTIPLMIGGQLEHPETPSARAYRTGEPVSISDMFADETVSEWRQVVAKQGYRSLLSIPLAGPGELGALTVYAEGAGAFQQEQIDLLTALAQGAAAAIEIVRLRESELAMMAELEQVDLMHQRLNRVALAGQGLDRILHALSDMTGYEMCAEEPTGDGIVAAWPSSHRGPQLAATDRSAMREIACEKLEMVERFDATSKGMVYLVPIVIADEVVALLWASGQLHPMGNTQRGVFERGAMVSSLELLRQRHGQEVEWRMRGDLFRDLLNLEAADEHRVVARARSYGHDILKPHLVLVIRPDEPASESALQHVIACTRTVAAGRSRSALVAAREGAVVMLLPQGDGSEPPTKTARAIVSLVAARGTASMTASVAIGDVCESPLDYRMATEVASNALRLSQSGRANGQVVQVADLGIFRLMLSAHEPAELRRFAEQTLGPLRQPQDSRNAALLPTLQAFAENDFQPGRTATALHLHPNTLTYRLRRIESLLGVPLRSSQGMLDVNFALAIDRFVRTSA